MKQSPKLPALRRRTQLIRAAEKVFASRGYFGATTEEIAKTAGLTKGALYYHFLSKEDIFFAVIKKIARHWTEKILAHFDGTVDPRTALEKSIRTAFDMIGHQKYVSVEFWQQAHKIRKIRNFLAGEHSRVRAKIVSYLVANCSVNENDCYYFVALVHAVFDGIMLRDTFCNKKSDRDRLADQVVEISLLYLNKYRKESV
jgi:AcrR family transcriptional regulator